MSYIRVEYGLPPVRIRSSAEIRAALGEPPPQRRELGLMPFTFWDGTVLPGGCNPLITKPLTEMDAIFEKYEYRLDGRGDDWCWNRRRVRGGLSWSMHSWATAVDINATANPYSYSFRSDMPPPMVREIEALNYRGRPVWAWGGRFGRNGVGKVDTMHWQLNLTPTEARLYADDSDPTSIALQGDDMLESFIRASYGALGINPDPKGFSYWFHAAAAERPNRGWTYQDCLESEQLGLMVALLKG